MRFSVCVTCFTGASFFLFKPSPWKQCFWFCKYKPNIYNKHVVMIIVPPPKVKTRWCKFTIWISIQLSSIFYNINIGISKGQVELDVALTLSVLGTFWCLYHWDLESLTINTAGVDWVALQWSKLLPFTKNPICDQARSREGEFSSTHWAACEYHAVRCASMQRSYPEGYLLSQKYITTP